MQAYRTLAATGSFSMVEKKSEFIGQAAPAVTEQEALDFLEAVRREHRTATHNVYAYVLREGARARYSDDGEPARTAGLPVLSVLQHAELQDCVVVVTRYYGGTLLGTGGLVRAYTSAAQGAVAAAGVATLQPCRNLTLACSYAQAEPATRILVQGGVLLQPPAYSADVTLCGTVLDGQQQALLPPLQELFRGEVPLQLGEVYFAPFARQEEPSNEQ